MCWECIYRIVFGSLRLPLVFAPGFVQLVASLRALLAHLFAPLTPPIPPSWLSWLLIYGPILGITTVVCRDQYSFTFAFSTWLAIAHGLAHVIFPFLDEHLGVVKSVSVWEDQTLHLGQAILFATILKGEKSNYFRVGAGLFILANCVNVAAGYLCWGKACHEVRRGRGRGRGRNAWSIVCANSSLRF